jgi:predicted ATPase
MITKWKLANFKTVRSETELSFAPLTIFAGANSSGKSSWIQSILMVCQTLSHRISSRSVVLNGALARLGQFDDLRSFNSEQRTITIGWQCEPRTPDGPATATIPGRSFRRYQLGAHTRPLTAVSCEIALDTRVFGASSGISQLNPGLASSRLVATIPGEDGVTESASIQLSRSETLAQKQADATSILDPSAPDFEPLNKSLQFDVELDGKSLEDVSTIFPSAQAIGCSCRHFLPYRISVKIDALAEKARILANYLTTENPRYILSGFFSDQDITIPRKTLNLLRHQLRDNFPPVNLGGPVTDTATLLGPKEITLRDWIEAVRKTPPQTRYRIREAIRAISGFSDIVLDDAKEGGLAEPAIKSVVVPTPLMEAGSYLDSVFSSSISYLGPLRDEPKPLYPLPAAPDLAYVGLKGEYTAAVLDLHKHKLVDFISPENFKEPTITWVTKSVALHKAVGDWLKYLGVADSVETNDMGKLGHELRVHTPGVAKAHDLTHAGVGVSQVLPILVSCLISDFDTTLLFEQPELHLHPAVQSRLGDFFLSMALVGKQCVIETHSEYLINRLRFRIAAAEIGAPLSSSTKIFFVEKRADTSTFREVVVNDFGAIPDWPEGFFDQSQEEAERILRAAATKRDAMRGAK